MSLRTKYIVFVVFIHLVTLVLAFFIFEENKLLFIAAEVLVIISLIVSFRLYKELIEPLRTLMTGIDAIRDRDFTVKFLSTGKREMDQLILVYNNMIDQLRIERTKQEQQHFFLEKLIQTSPTGIIILDFEKIIEQVNPRALSLLGADLRTMVGKPIASVGFPMLEQINSMQAGDSKTISINGINTYKIQVSSFVDRGFPRLFIMIEELTAEILATEKKVYEKIIRMMAHEVNNTIGPVNSILNSTLRHPGITGNESELMHSALQVAIDRNNNLNRFMRNFADLVKLPPPGFRAVDMNALIRRISLLMSVRAQQSQIKLVVKETGPSMLIQADELQMEQAIINIVKNSMESIGQEGTVVISLDADRRSLTVMDSGNGISAEDSGRLFSSFFSTKKDGQGIGLMLVREVLMNHGFSFSLRTVAPRDTRFTIQF